MVLYGSSNKIPRQSDRSTMAGQSFHTAMEAVQNMRSILSNAQIAHFSLFMRDEHHQIGEQIELVIEEIKAICIERGEEFIDDGPLRDKVTQRLGAALEEKLFRAQVEQIGLYTEAAFAIGWYSAKHPEWLFFREPTATPLNSVNW
jgi:hypothetical protein